MKTTAKKPAKVQLYRENTDGELRWKIEDDRVWVRPEPRSLWRPALCSVELFLRFVRGGRLIPADEEPAPSPITAKLLAAYDTRSGVVYYETAGETKAKVLRVVKATLPGDRDVKVIPLTVTYTPPMAKVSRRRAKQEASK